MNLESFAWAAWLAAMMLVSGCIGNVTENESAGDATSSARNDGSGDATGDSAGDATQSGDPLRPADGSGDPLQPADGSGDPRQPTDGSGDPLRPTDGSGDPLRPADGSGDPLRPTDGSGDPLRPSDGVGDPLQPADANGGDPAPVTLAGQPFTTSATYWPWLETNSPSAHHHSDGRTYVVFSMGAPNEDDAGIIAYDQGTGSFSSVVKIADTNLPSTDNHGQPVVTVTDDGKIHVVFDGHGVVTPEGMRHLVSTSAGDISAWTELSDIESVATYPSLYKMANGDVYYLYRNGNHRTDWRLARMTNHFTTEASDVSILSGGATHANDDYLRVDPTYADSWYVYGVKGIGDTIHLLFNYHACPPSNDHFDSEGNNQGPVLQYNLYYLMLDTTDGTWRNRAGTDVSASIPLDLAAADSCCLVRPSTPTTGNAIDTTQRYYQMQVSVDANDEPYILAVHGMPRDGVGDTASLFKPTPGGWSEIVLPDDGHVGKLLIHSATDIELVSPIWRRSTDGGATWQLTRTLTSAASGATLDASRNPGVEVRNADPVARWLFVDGGLSPNATSAGLYLFGSGGFVEP